MRDRRQLFEQLNDTLVYTWENMFDHTRDCYETNGDLNVPSNFRIGDGYTLGVWIQTQKAVRKGLQGKVLSKERIKLLDEIGMLWVIREQDRWMEYYTATKVYGPEVRPSLCV